MEELLDPPVAGPRVVSSTRGGGPRSVIGRMRARENAVGESLFSKVVFSRKMAISILERNALLSARFHPTTPYELMLVADMALAKARLDRVAALQVENCDHSIDRATRFWSPEQQARALKLLARLPKDPPRMAHALCRFKQGAELLIQRWEGLAAVAGSGVDWDEEQRRLAMDLLGTPLVLRAGNSKLLPPAGDTAGLAALAAREIARLQEKLVTRLDELDEYSQEEALVGLSPEPDPTTKRLDRYEAIFNRAYNKAETELTRVRKEGEAKSNGTVTSPRAWDVDPLIQRIKLIERPPAMTAEIEAVIGPVGQVADGPGGAKGPGTGPVVPDPHPVAAPAPEAVVRETEAGSATESPTAPPARIPAAPSAERLATTPQASTVATSIFPPAPMSRRARKVHQRRLQKAAHRKAGEKGQ